MWALGSQMGALVGAEKAAAEDSFPQFKLKIYEPSGAVAVILGGSRGTGEINDDSDWDLTRKPDPTRTIKW